MKMTEHQRNLALSFYLFMVLTIILGSVAIGLFFGARWGVLTATICIAWLGAMTFRAYDKSVNGGDDDE